MGKPHQNLASVGYTTAAPFTIKKGKLEAHYYPVKYRKIRNKYFNKQKEVVFPKIFLIFYVHTIYYSFYNFKLTKDPLFRITISPDYNEVFERQRLEHSRKLKDNKCAQSYGKLWYSHNLINMNKYCYRRGGWSGPVQQQWRIAVGNRSNQLTSGQHGVWVTAAVWLSACKRNNKLWANKSQARQDKLRGNAAKTKGSTDGKHHKSPKISLCYCSKAELISGWQLAVGSWLFGPECRTPAHIVSHLNCQPKWQLIRAFSRSLATLPCHALWGLFISQFALRFGTLKIIILLSKKNFISINLRALQNLQHIINIQHFKIWIYVRYSRKEHTLFFGVQGMISLGWASQIWIEIRAWLSATRLY